MKRILIVAFVLLNLSACSILYPGFSSKEPSISSLVIGSTTYKEILNRYGPPAFHVFQYPRGAFVKYYFKTPEALISRSDMLHGNYHDGCHKCGELKLSLLRTDETLYNMVLIGVERVTPDLQAQYAKGLKLIEQRDFNQALPLMRAAAAQHYSEAQFTLGLMYIHGDGVPQDYKSARFWIGRAAASGHLQARYDLAAMLRNGEGGPVDKVAAKEIFLLCAHEGHGMAAQELAKMYREEGDQVNAAKWQETADRAATGSQKPSFP